MKIETSTAEVFLKDKVVVVKYKADANVALEDVLAIHEAEKKLTSEKKHLTLLDARDFITVSDAALKFGASAKPAKYRAAAAVLVNTLGMRMLGNMYLIFNKPKVPKKMFSDEKKAMDWLNGFSEKK